METVKEIIVFFSQFLVVIMPMFVMVLFILLIKFLTYKPENELKATSNDINPNNLFAKNKLNLYDYSIEKLEECLETKKNMGNKSIRKELEKTKEEIIELKEEKENIEEEIVLPVTPLEKVNEYVQIEEAIIKKIENNKDNRLMILIEEKFDKFDWKLKHVKTPKDLEKFNYEYEKFKSYKKHAKKKFEEFEKKIVKKTNEIKKKYPHIVIKEIKKEESIISNKKEEPIVPLVNDDQVMTSIDNEKRSEQPVQTEIKLSKEEKANNEKRLERLKKINSQIKAKENKASLLTASMFSAIAITSVINKKSKGIKKQPGNVSKPAKVNKIHLFVTKFSNTIKNVINRNKKEIIKPTKVETKANMENFIVKPKEQLPKGNLQVFIKPSKKTILSRIGEFINKVVFLPIATIIRMERVRKLEKERVRRQEITNELEGMKLLKRKLQQTKKPVQKVMQKEEKPKVLVKKKENKEKKKRKVTVGV